jgi:hypothetical protein
MQNLDFDLDYTYDGPGEETIPPAAVMIRTDVVLVDQCTLDVKTRDILIITTRRIEFGTPAWCEKMVEINSKPKAQ